MQLTNHQMVALEEICHWLDNWNLKEKAFYTLVGYAGTGKTVLIAELVDNLKMYAKLEDKEERKVAIATLTWKAAHVLRQRGIKSACSIHSLIYNAERNIITKEWEFSRKSKKELQDEYTLIIIDEASMVDKTMREDLASYEIPILYVGDSFQLPPVTKDIDDLNFLSNPDSRLTEILRQALDNPIIKLSMMIRNGQTRFNNGDNFDNKVFIFAKNQLRNNWLLSANIVIVGYNKSRIIINSKIRSLKGYDPEYYPVLGENLIAISSCKERKIYNGQGFISDKDYSDSRIVPNLIKLLSIKSEDENAKSHLIRTIFTDHKSEDYKIPFKTNGQKELLQLAFGYAITAHKSQGSQWEKVVVVNEPIGSNQEDRARWTYTAITRAVDKLILLQ